MLGRFAVGKKYGRLTVLAVRRNDQGRSVVDCRCDCGNKVVGRSFISVQRAETLYRRMAKETGKRYESNCGGCRVRGNRIHQYEYRLWMGIKRRCYNEKDQAYSYYGGRGIGMCTEWREDFWTFAKYLRQHLGTRPSKKHQLDRYPNMNGNYEPGNIRWATPKENSNNTRKNIVVEYEGEQLSLSEVARRANVPYMRLYGRIKNGIGIDLALRTPKQTRKFTDARTQS